MVAAPPAEAGCSCDTQLQVQQCRRHYSTVSEKKAIFWVLSLCEITTLFYQSCHVLLLQSLNPSAPCVTAGYMYCNLPGLEAKEGQRIRIYYMSLGTQVDLHTPGLAGASQVLPTGWLAPVSHCAGRLSCALPTHCVMVCDWLECILCCVLCTLAVLH